MIIAGKAFARGRLALLLWVALGLCFFGSLGSAAHYFPHHYIWHRVVMSSLASPRDNPRAYGIARAGLTWSGLLLAPFAFFLRRQLGPFAPGLTRAAGILLLIGAIFLALSGAVVPGHYRLFGLGRNHEHFAQVSSIALSTALVLYFGAVLRLPRKFSWLRWLGGLVVLAPVSGLVASRLSLLVAWLFFTPAIFRAVRASSWNNLALWEWIGATALYVFLGLVIFLGPQEDSAWRQMFRASFTRR